MADAPNDIIFAGCPESGILLFLHHFRSPIGERHVNKLKFSQSGLFAAATSFAPCDINLSRGKHDMRINALLGTALVASVFMTAPVQAAVFTLTGNTTGGPTYNRTLAGTPPTALSAVGTAVRYNTLAFSVSAAGSYDFLLLSTTANYDPFLTLYAGSFNPSSPLANAVVANDDFSGLTDSGFTRALATGQNYFLVTAGFDNLDFGSYNLTINGPGSVITANTAVPEPATWALMLLGFGGVGYAMRRRQQVSSRIRFAEFSLSSRQGAAGRKAGGSYAF